MSGELRAPADWTPPGTVEERHRVRRERQIPTTRRGMLLHGTLRYVVVLALLVAATAAVALLVVWLADAEQARAFPLAFYLAGATVIAGGFLLSTGGSGDWMPDGGIDRAERDSWIGSSLVYVAFGVPLVAIGALLDSLL